MATDTHATQGDPRLARRAVVILTAAVALAFVQAIVNFIADIGAPYHDTFPQMVIGYLPVWLIIALLTPAIDVMVSRFPWVSGRMTRVIPVHFAASVGFAVTHLLLLSVFHASFGLSAPGYSILGTVQTFLIQYIMLDMAIYWGIAGTLLGAHHAATLRDRELAVTAMRAGLTEARLQNLRAQMQPHFLFNTLNTVSMQVRQGMDGEAIEMLSEISELLRANVHTEAAQQTTLAEELELVRRYLRIEQVRFGMRLKVAFDVSPDALAASVPAFLLQPIVENAIRYGVSARPGMGTVTISATRTPAALTIRVVDDGTGLPSDSRDSHESGNGVGLSNTRQRIEQLYGSAASIELTPRAAGGACCTIVIPVHV